MPKAGDKRNGKELVEEIKEFTKSFGPLDPFKEHRKALDDPQDKFEGVLMWISRAWRELDAVEIVGVVPSDWAKWVQLNPEPLRKAKVYGRNIIYAGARGNALGVISQRGQASAQKAILGQLADAVPPVTGNGAAKLKIAGAHSAVITNAMEDFDDDDLKEIAFGDESSAAS